MNRRLIGGRKPLTVAIFTVLAICAVGASSGCSQKKPCMIIPAQIELAQSKRDQAKEAYDQKMEEVTRSLNNLEVSRGRLERLTKERDELKALLGEVTGEDGE